MKEYMEKLYSILNWPEEPGSSKAEERYKEALDSFTKVLKHPFIVPKAKRRVKILDLLGGTGIGGIALSKVIKESGTPPDLIILDLRENALRMAEEFGKEVLGYEPTTILGDALEVHRLVEDIDIALIYGYSMPHFDPWQMARLLASISNVLKDDGVIIVQEIDRRYIVFYKVGYKEIIPMLSGEEVFLDFHGGYNLIRGTFKRYYHYTKTGELISADVFFWGIAELLTFIWLFFREVDLIPIPERTTSHFLLGQGPRRRIKLEDLEVPVFLSKSIELR